MHGRWRLFRHDAGRVSGPPAWAYVLLFAACLLVGIWSAKTFSAVVIWPANGVMLAALLQLRRRQAVSVLTACLALNLFFNVVRGDPQPMLWLNAVLNLGQVVLAALIARRVCGAALDLRRPRRLINFATMAVVPAVITSSLLILSVVAPLRHYSPTFFLFTFQRLLGMETLGMMIVTPALLLIAKAHRFRSAAPASPVETGVLVALLLGVTGLVFFQTATPALFILFPFLLLVSFRTSPSWVAVSIIGVAVIGGIATLTGHGPVVLTRPRDVAGLEAVPLLMRQLVVDHVFLLGVVITALPVSTSMSERRRLIERLERRTAAAHVARRRAEDADAAKSRFLALMSHEMRTPLNSVSGYAEVLARRPSMEPEVLVQLGLIRRSGDALLMLVEDVLEISRGDDVLHPVPLSLDQVIEDSTGAARIVAEGKGLSLTVQIRPDALVPFLGDARRLRQALHHLIGNAVKFTDHGGVTILADRIGDEVLIAVTDTGPGLDIAKVDRLFEPFVQGDDSISRTHIGAGIGLALVKRQASLMGGWVVVDSEPGDGATFTLRLPLALADPAATVDGTRQGLDTDEDGLCDHRPPRVLVVDDHPANREVARLMLAAAGCDIVEADNGEDAIQMACGQAFDLILMDVRMPRVDGLAATRAIRAMGITVPVLAVTADAMPEDAACCLAAGMNAHLAKPYSHHALYAAMERLLKAPEVAEAAAA
jgi:signal transduction histidine kinase/CheY-like chemotaxis protein